ncbi:hypothetical protein GGS23DRAFT_559390 [Durotheca rogersii]|uniref:uncharacterized protein n=1 Tax=Durotheca rogersii TaxID=419775 RepID=UPI00221E7925|nr:uncharacterized protein GGS23DRAFT_559390 [Durotheca rogersii]KAI5865476.1 hypothetical protein GGS23DRAFT_559390 [Durotheca rogersii]
MCGPTPCVSLHTTVLVARAVPDTCLAYLTLTALPAGSSWSASQAFSRKSPRSPNPASDTVARDEEQGHKNKRTPPSGERPLADGCYAAELRSLTDLIACRHQRNGEIQRYVVSPLPTRPSREAGRTLSWP